MAQLILSDVEIAVGGSSQLDRLPTRRRHHDDAFVRKALTHTNDWGGQVAVSGHQHGGIESVVEGDRQKLSGHVDVRHLLFEVCPMGATTATLPVFLQVMAVVAAQLRPGRQRFQIQGLPLHVGLIVALEPDAGGEIVGVQQFLPRFE